MKTTDWLPVLCPMFLSSASINSRVHTHTACLIKVVVSWSVLSVQLMSVFQRAEGAGPPHPEASGSTSSMCDPRFALLCLAGGGRDLDGEPGAVLQTILRVHVQHLVIDRPALPPPDLIQPDASRHTANKRQALIPLSSLSDPHPTPSPSV